MPVMCMTPELAARQPSVGCCPVMAVEVANTGCVSQDKLQDQLRTWKGLAGPVSDEMAVVM